MKNTMKKMLALALAVLMVSAAVASVSAGPVLTDKDTNKGNLTGGYMPGYYPGYKPGYDYPFWGDLDEGILNKNAKCPDCDKSCYQYVNVVDGCVIFTYLCTTHGMVTPVAPKPEEPPVEEEKGDFKIFTTTTRGGTIKLNSDKPIKKGDSRTVYITPDFGYICTGVYLNGRYMGVVEELELKWIWRDYSVLAFFEAVNTKRDNTVAVEVTGNGKVTGRLNGADIGEVGTTSIKYKDRLFLTFETSSNYKVESVKINDVEMGPITSYSLERLYYDVKIEVTYKWENPWVDVKNHLTAVEYVTENGIMGSPNQFMNTDQFQGDRKVNKYLLCAFLAEMADDAGVLNTNKERAAWGQKMGVVDENTNVTLRPTYAETAEIVLNYLRVVEKEWGVTFTALKNADAKETAKLLGFYNENTYESGKPSRYDVAEICYAIAQLEVK